MTRDKWSRLDVGLIICRESKDKAADKIYEWINGLEWEIEQGQRVISAQQTECDRLGNEMRTLVHENLELKSRKCKSCDATISDYCPTCQKDWES